MEGRTLGYDGWMSQQEKRIELTHLFKYVLESDEGHLNSLNVISTAATAIVIFSLQKMNIESFTDSVPHCAEPVGYVKQRSYNVCHSQMVLEND